VVTPHVGPRPHLALVPEHVGVGQPSGSGREDHAALVIHLVADGHPPTLPPTRHHAPPGSALKSTRKHVPRRGDFGGRRDSATTPSSASADGSARAPAGYPPAIAPTTSNGSRPLATSAGSAPSAGSSERSSPQAKKRMNARRRSVS